ncbi:MAG: ABC transporter transmembrane domain-containing protein [Propionibacteriaceae bacterium]
MSNRIFPAQIRAYEPGATSYPDTRSPQRFLLWLIWQQRTILSLMLVLALFQIVSALIPMILGRAVQEGIVARDMTQMWRWVGWLSLVVIVALVGGIYGHTVSVSGWLVAMYRNTALTVRKALQLGHVLPRRTPTGEVLSVASSDSDTFGACAINLPQAFSSICGIITTVIIVMQINWRLGLVVLIAAPVMVFGAAPLLRPLGEARTIERSRSSLLTGQATDIVAGLRILRGIGGEQTFGDNYAKQSASVKRSSIIAAAWQVGVDALAILMSGLLLVLLTYLGVHEITAGRLDVGGLISFFGYAVFLVNPIQTIFTFTQRWVQGLVAAEKTIGVLGQSSPWPTPDQPKLLPRNATIIDEASGFTAQPGRLTMVVSAAPDESAALADRLGRYFPRDRETHAPELAQELKGKAGRADRAAKFAAREAIARRDAELARARWGVTVGGVDLADVDIRDVRRDIFVSDSSASMFAGTLQEAIDPLSIATREQAEDALRVASAEDVFAGLPNGWQGRIDERGRGLSGGQRQRVILARALIHAPEILVLVEPTSAVDAHTEARIAQRLASAREGKTTIIMSASPLLLHYADDVVLLANGQAIASGSHDALLRDSAAYRDVIARESEAGDLR